jgi:hypothetical protein
VLLWQQGLKLTFESVKHSNRSLFADTGMNRLYTEQMQGALQLYSKQLLSVTAQTVQDWKRELHLQTMCMMLCAAQHCLETCLPSTLQLQY